MEEESFTLTLDFDNQALEFPARLTVLGYTYRFIVQVAGTDLIFEPDEERRIRAIIHPASVSSELNPALIRAIGHELQHIISS